MATLYFVAPAGNINAAIPLLALICVHVVLGGIITASMAGGDPRFTLTVAPLIVEGGVTGVVLPDPLQPASAAAIAEMMIGRNRVMLILSWVVERA
jgi:hypothetical protein